MATAQTARTRATVCRECQTGSRREQRATERRGEAYRSVHPSQNPLKERILHGLLQPVEAKATPRQARFPYFETSEQGRRLSGIIGLFGSLEYAGQTFDDGYWRSVLLQLAGVAENQRKSQVTRVEGMLEQASGADGIGTPEARTTLAHRLVARLEYFARPTPSISWDEFRKRFSELKRAA